LEGENDVFRRRHVEDFFSRSVNCGDWSFKRHKLDKNNTLNPEGFGLEVKTLKTTPGSCVLLLRLLGRIVRENLGPRLQAGVGRLDRGDELTTRTPHNRNQVNKGGESPR